MEIGASAPFQLPRECLDVSLEQLPLHPSGRQVRPGVSSREGLGLLSDGHLGPMRTTYSNEPSRTFSPWAGT